MNRIVTHSKEGQIVKGYTSDFSPNKGVFHLFSTDKSQPPKEIAVTDLKAIFFVKKFEGDSLRIDSHEFSKAPVSARHIVIFFNDGEKFYGTSGAIHRERIGFFVFPIDPECNTERAFVINSFISNVEIVE